MYITVAKNVLAEAISNGGLAALGNEGQSQESKRKEITKSCILVTADKDSVSFESHVNRMSAKMVTAVDGDLVSVSDEGEACIPAKELQGASLQMSDGNVMSIKFVPNEDKVKQDMTAQAILDKEQRQKDERKKRQRSQYQKVDRDW